MQRVKVINGILNTKLPYTLPKEEYHSCMIITESSTEEILYCAFLNDSTLIDKLGLNQLYEYEKLAYNTYYIIKDTHTNNPYWNIRVQDAAGYQSEEAVDVFIRMLNSDESNSQLSELIEFTSLGEGKEYGCVVGGEEYACELLWDKNSEFLHHENCMCGRNEPQAGGGGAQGDENPEDEILDQNEVDAIFAKYIGKETIIDDWGDEVHTIVIPLEEFITMNNEEEGKAKAALYDIQDYFSEGSYEYNRIRERCNYFKAENFVKEDGKVEQGSKGYSYNVKELIDFKKENGFLTWDQVADALDNNTQGKDVLELLKLKYQFAVLSECICYGINGGIEGFSNASYYAFSGHAELELEIFLDKHFEKSDIYTLRTAHMNNFEEGNYSEDYINDPDYEIKKWMFLYVKGICDYNYNGRKILSEYVQ